MEFDALTLARIQFAFTISFHIVFPAFTIGIASYLAVLEGLWLATGRNVFLALFNYWKKIFAISFGMGVVSGIVLSYQLGTNWSTFSDKTGPILGPLLGYEVLSAFFLDELSGKETYGVGRYIDFDVKGLPKTLTIDFNRAYNPNCARSPFTIRRCRLSPTSTPSPSAPSVRRSRRWWRRSRRPYAGRPSFSALRRKASQRMLRWAQGRC